ncbi:MAG TPA: 50S ribosomal protein L25/general stress protein Ctc [Burkholderiaceae bacterium]|nr:50S ribosomal protein L25/general stress protein Ctc [Burkholderiaceae bacterium]
MKVVANKRESQGTGASRRLRHTGKVPGVLYGGKGDAQAIEVEHNPLFHALRKEKFHASILDMELDGASERVLLRAFQMHPYKAQVLHIDFQRVAEDQKLHMRVPLHFSGQEGSPAAKTENVLISHVMSEVAIACLPRDLPEYIEVELSELTVNDTVRVRDLKMPNGVTPVLKGKENPVVVAVTVRGEEVAEEEVAATVAATADVPATAQKAPTAEEAAASKADKGGKTDKGGKGDKGDKDKKK